MQLLISRHFRFNQSWPVIKCSLSNILNWVQTNSHKWPRKCTQQHHNHTNTALWTFSLRSYTYKDCSLLGCFSSCTTQVHTAGLKFTKFAIESKSIISFAEANCKNKQCNYPTVLRPKFNSKWTPRQKKALCRKLKSCSFHFLFNFNPFHVLPYRHAIQLKYP